jgi:hypothetical protein
LAVPEHTFDKLAASAIRGRHPPGVRFARRGLGESRDRWAHSSLACTGPSLARDWDGRSSQLTDAQSAQRTRAAVAMVRARPASTSRSSSGTRRRTQSRSLSDPASSSSIRSSARIAECPGWDSNPHWIGFEPTLSAGWSTGADRSGCHGRRQSLPPTHRPSRRWSGGRLTTAELGLSFAAASALPPLTRSVVMTACPGEVREHVSSVVAIPLQN